MCVVELRRTMVIYRPCGPHTVGMFGACSHLRCSLPNRATGRIPERLGDMTALTELWLENNQLGGETTQQFATNFWDFSNAVIWGLASDMNNVTSSWLEIRSELNGGRATLKFPSMRLSRL